MSRKPVDKDASERQGKPYGRQAMWEAMRKNGVFTLYVLANASGRDKSSVRGYIKGLLAAGIIEEFGYEPSPRSTGSQYKNKLYRLLQNIGHEAPRLKADGTPVIKTRDNMWRTMKILSAFTAPELAVNAATEECEVSPVDAADYCKHLHKAGYLAVLSPGSHKGKAVYKLLPGMNTGPHAPMVQRTKVVFDPNLNSVMWNEEIEP